MVRMRETTEESQRGGRRWMTQADILAKYQNGRSYEDARDIAQEIVNGKESCPHMKVHHIRPHPNCPTRQDMRLFLVWDEEYETHKKDTVVESLFDCSDGGDKKKTRKLQRTKGNVSRRHLLLRVIHRAVSPAVHHTVVLVVVLVEVARRMARRLPRLLPRTRMAARLARPRQ